MACLGCIDISGSSSIIPNGTNEYNVFFNEDCFNDIDLRLLVSYTGSTLTNGVDFYGPTSSFIMAGTNSLKIYIKANDISSGTIRVTVNLPDYQCDNYIDINVESEDINNPSSNTVTNNCSEIGFFWEPYGHVTKKATVR